jgi:hypothetical protein
MLLKRRFEIAENLYIFYCISRMWMPTPLVIYKSVCLNDIYRQLFGLTKMAFVWAVILFWWIWDMSTHISDFSRPLRVEVLLGERRSGAVLSGHSLSERAERCHYARLQRDAEPEPDAPRVQLQYLQHVPGY